VKKWLVLVVSVLGLSNVYGDPTHDKLVEAINALSGEVMTLQAKLIDLSQSQASLLIAARSVNIGRASLLAGAVASGSPGSNVSFPISFVKGPAGVAALQWDLVVPSSFTVLSVTAGPVATAAGKSVQYVMSGNVARIIIFGLNQDVIETGVVAIVTVRPLATIPRGTYPIPVRSPVASNAAGGSVLILETSGAVIL